MTYDGSAQEPCTVAVTGAGGLSLTPDPVYTNNINAGTTNAAYTYAGDANHTGSSDSQDFTIDQKPVLVTPTAGQSKYFRAADPVFTYTLGEAIPVTGALSRVAGESVGFYAITLGTLAPVSSTVPLKFNVYSGSTELTTVAAVKGFKATLVSCMAFIDVPADEIDLTSTGGTELRYTDSQFIQNWKTAKNPGKCYSVAMTTQDGSTLDAHFKLK